MLRNLLRTSIASLVLMSGSVSGAPPPQHEYHVDIASDITASLDSGFQKFTKNTQQVNFQKCTPNCVPFSLGSFWQTAAFSVESGSNCFPVGMVGGAIHVSKARKDASAAKAVFWFKSAFNPNGYNGTGVEVKYVLTLTGWLGWIFSSLAR